jgi:hypothetical protein
MQKRKLGKPLSQPLVHTLKGNTWNTADSAVVA